MTPEQKARKAAYNNAYYHANIEAMRAKSRARYAADPNAKARRRQKNRTWRGVINATGETRFGKCPICENDRRLNCDHWHDGPKAGQIRGWLCNMCNSFLGGRRLENAIAYMKEAQ